MELHIFKKEFCNFYYSVNTIFKGSPFLKGLYMSTKAKSFIKEYESISNLRSW